MPGKEYANNPKANFDYEILETIEAGLVLRGFEVKAIRAGKASIKGAYVKIIDGKPELIGATVSPYQPGNTPGDYDPQATRMLLLTKKQTDTLIGRAQSQGTALVPLKLYDHNHRVKLLIGIAKGKKKYDKRATLKKKDIARAKQRGLTED
ncbi:MAG TPA: SsrA-binding protein SmpB [Candidatus Paceibacterota bacterium]|nr:SsrA-binding protein SmpB [Candidatus Paceibacterota bacterium]